MSLALSESLKQDKFLEPPKKLVSSREKRRKVEYEDEEEDDDEDEQYDLAGRTQRRRANVYDAVAGRVTARGFAQNVPKASKYRDTASSGARIRRPEEILFRDQHPMIQVETGEPYFAHENLPADRPLPSSDLLQSIHAYASDFYKYTLGESGRKSHYSLNESALLAVGILVEEMAKDGLGETGDLVMIEPSGKKGEISGNPADYIVKPGRKVGWRAHIDGKKPKSRRSRSRSNTQPRRKRPRLEDMMAVNRANRANQGSQGNT